MEKRRNNESVFIFKEIILEANEVKVIDFNLLDNSAYRIGTPFNNLQISNFGDDLGNNTENIIVYINQDIKQKYKIRKNFIFDEENKKISSLKLENPSSNIAKFDIYLNNNETEISLLKKLNGIKED